MNILLISSDQSVFREGSDTRIRLKTYAQIIGTLHVLCRAPKRIEEQDGPLVLHGVPASKLLSPFALMSRAHELVLKENIMVVSAQDPFEHGLAALQAVRGTRAQLHIQVHTDFLSPWYTRTSLLNRVRVLLAAQVLPHAAAVRVVSKRVAEAVTATYGVRSVAVIPIVTEPAPPTVGMLPTTFAFTLITHCRVEKEKRLGDVLEALRIARHTYPDVGLVVVGEGRERRSLELLSRRLGLTDAVVFLGERSDARSLLGAADAYIQASAYEGYGRSLIEAALAKLPIITTNVGIVDDVLIDTESALVASVGDSRRLAEHIGALRGDEALRESLAARAWQEVAAHLASLGDTKEAIARDLMHTARTP